MTARALRFPSRATADTGPSQDQPYTGPTPEIDPYATTYTITQAAYLISVSTEQTRQWAENGTIPAIHTDNGWEIPRTRLTDWIGNLPEA
ncbi:hypothetical protein GCM10022222_40230 [Amycolatopsis ultiminotia]|uniref:Helix-turn-helix domain-containing protein n=1 Tax=Amycolatopsis ultiminotia TaxID=543629 RepID=A0ABP6WL89_9PSEU